MDSSVHSWQILIHSTINTVSLLRDALKTIICATNPRVRRHKREPGGDPNWALHQELLLIRTFVWHSVWLAGRMLPCPYSAVSARLTLAGWARRGPSRCRRCGAAYWRGESTATGAPAGRRPRRTAAAGGNRPCAPGGRCGAPRPVACGPLPLCSLVSRLKLCPVSQEAAASSLDDALLVSLYIRICETGFGTLYTKNYWIDMKGTPCYHLNTVGARKMFSSACGLYCSRRHGRMVFVMYVHARSCVCICAHGLCSFQVGSSLPLVIAQAPYHKSTHIGRPVSRPWRSQRA